MKEQNIYQNEFFIKYPDLKKLGHNLFNTKLWILLILHEESLTSTQISSKTCKSLKEECPTYGTLQSVVSNHLFVGKIITTAVDKKSFELMPNVAFEITQFKNDAEIQANQKGQNLYNFIQNCTGEPIDPIHESIRWKTVFPEILAESAKGAIRVMFALVFGV